MSQTCACPRCKALATPSFQRGELGFCSQACADRHPDKQPCPRSDCHCEQAVFEEDEGTTYTCPRPGRAPAAQR